MFRLFFVLFLNQMFRKHVRLWTKLHFWDFVMPWLNVLTKLSKSERPQPWASWIRSSSWSTDCQRCHKLCQRPNQTANQRSGSVFKVTNQRERRRFTCNFQGLRGWLDEQWHSRMFGHKAEMLRTLQLFKTIILYTWHLKTTWDTLHPLKRTTFWLKMEHLEFIPGSNNSAVSQPFLGSLPTI